MTATFLIEAAHVELLVLLLCHPKAFSVGTVLRHKPLLWGGATEGAGGEAPVVLHDDLSMDSLHEIVDEDGSPQVDFRIINEFQLFQRHVKNMGPLLKHGDCLRMQKTQDMELKATSFVPDKEKENEAKYSLCVTTFLFFFGGI